MGMLCPTLLRMAVDYEPETGKMTWRAKPSFMVKGGAGPAARQNAIHAGQPAFTSPAPNGYKRGELMGQRLLAHRVAWAIHHGEWPQAEIDHANGDAGDNRISNLRLATRSENARNRGASKGKATKYKGIHRISSGKWVAQITLAGKSVHVATCINERDAAMAYNAAARHHYGEFCRLNQED